MENNKSTGYLVPASIVLAGIIIGYAWISVPQKLASVEQTATKSPQSVAQSVELPVVWGNLGTKMIGAGVIDRAQFDTIYESRGGLSNAEKQLLESSQNGKLKINQENSGLWLNLLWALGLGNKNEILEKGPMSDPRYGGAGGFASTGGWILANGGAMDHYSKHLFIVLTPEQQALVEKTSKNIYRPCCSNPAYFPDCNHGMAMLGLLELMASQGTSEDEMYQTARQMNSFWFPDQPQGGGSCGV